MLIGFPVAFSLSALGLLCGLRHRDGWFSPAFMANLPLNVFGILSNDLLLAIPFFTLMGAILEKCGLAEDMLDSMGQLFRPGARRPGLLGDHRRLHPRRRHRHGGRPGDRDGDDPLPVMMRYGYNMRYATGVLATSGTITQLVPPSLVLVVLADQLSAARWATCTRVPGGRRSCRCCCSRSTPSCSPRVRPDFVPGVPKGARTLSGPALVIKCLRGIIPSFVLIFAVLGSMGGLPGINTAICTPTEAGAMGAVGASSLAGMHGRLKWGAGPGRDGFGTMRITAMVVFIPIGSRVSRWCSRCRGGGIEHMLTSLPGGRRLSHRRQRLHLLPGLLPRLPSRSPHPVPSSARWLRRWAST